MNQRWLHHRSSYRLPDEVIQTSEYEVAPIDSDYVARSFIETHHYSHSYPAARFRFGLYRKTVLVGVSVFSVPCCDAALTNVFPEPAELSADLGRFVLLDFVPGNGESWFLGRCFALLKREGLIGVIAFSDPFPRRDIHGAVVHKGHIGTIYQAFNGRYLGRTQPRALRLLPDGSVFSSRTLQKIRARERGWQYGVKILENFGAPRLIGDPVAWLAEWLPRLTRKVRHPGNHKYAWPLNQTVRKSMPESLPYPKAAPLLYATQLEAG